MRRRRSRARGEPSEENAYFIATAKEDRKVYEEAKRKCHLTEEVSQPLGVCVCVCVCVCV